MVERSFVSSLQERMHCLQELTDFTENCQAELKDLFEALGWKEELDTHAVRMEICPYNPDHKVPQDRMEKHKAVCQLTQQEYSKEEQAEMYDPSVYYENTNIPSITLDKDTFQQVILHSRENGSHVRSTGLHTPITGVTHMQIFLMYHRIISGFYVTSLWQTEENQSGPKSHLEVLAEMRDYRRRRQSYRAKNVHITKKTYTEVIREVINIHSGELGRIWQEAKHESQPSQQSSQRGESERGRCASVESRESCIGSRDEHEHKRHRKRSRSHKRSRERKKKSKRDSHSPDVERHHKKKKKNKS